MQAIGMAKPPVGVIFDADLGNSIDGPLALALLYGLDGKNEARVVSTSVSKHCLASAALAEVIARFYAGSVNADFGSSSRSLPVGMSIAGKSPEPTPFLNAVLDRKNAEGKPAYNHGILQLNDTADVHAVIRNAFTSQQDQNCVVVLAGPATNLAGVLGLPGAKALIAQKVRTLVWAPGRLGLDPAAAQRVLADWPSPIVVVSPELADSIRFPASALDTLFNWTETHPVVDAYRAAAPMPYDAPTGALAAVLYAAKPEGFFTLSPAGTFSLSGQNTLAFKPGPGTHHLLQLDPAQKGRVLETYLALASAKPVVRQPRRRRPDAVKPPEVKPLDEPSKPESSKPTSSTSPPPFDVVKPPKP